MLKRVLKSFVSFNSTSISVGLVLLVLVVLLFRIPILDLIELKTYDLRFRSGGVTKPSGKVVMAVIDEKSLDYVGVWPWPRVRIAELVDRLSEEGARVVAFDLFFTEPDKNSSLNLILEMERQVNALRIGHPELRRFIEEARSKADNDLLLANALKRAKAKVVLGHFFHMSKSSLGYAIEQKDIDEQLSRIENSRYPLVRYEDRGIELDPFIGEFIAHIPEGNLEILARAAGSSGYINMVPDPDGIIRSLFLIAKCGREIYSPLAIQSVMHYLDQPQLMVKVAAYGVEGIRMGDRFIPTDETGRMLIKYRGPEKTFPHYSIRDILERKLPDGTFKDKIVIVGGTAIGLGDIRNTPFSSAGEYPGMEVHATVIDNILERDFLHKPRWATIFDIFAILALGLLVGIVVPRLGPMKGMVFGVGLFALYIFLSRWLFVRFGLWVSVVYPLMTLVLVYIALTLHRYIVEEKDKRFLNAAFASYVSPELIDEMVRSETMPDLGGEARTITAYFTDIESFSTFSEVLTAHQLVQLLNEYLAVMTGILISERGTLDKYEGDAIVAFLGAPADVPDHSLRACKVAVAMQRALGDLRRKWGQEKQLPGEPHRNTRNLPPDRWVLGDKWPKVVHSMRMRIGINSGDMVVGNMGSATRMSYTMMGDSVNLAARLEAGAKQFGIYTAVSEYTLNLEYVDENGERRRTMDAVEARFIDNITVVGKSEPVKIYELCAMKGDLTEQEKELFRIFHQGMQFYLKMEWPAAVSHFEESLKIERVPEGKTTPSEVFIKRCKEFMENPPVAPGEKWDGIYRMTQK